jgi:hypothetical protein
VRYSKLSLQAHCAHVRCSHSSAQLTRRERRSRHSCDAMGAAMRACGEYQRRTLIHNSQRAGEPLCCRCEPPMFEQPQAWVQQPLGV